MRRGPQVQTVAGPVKHKEACRVGRVVGGAASGQRRIGRHCLEADARAIGTQDQAIAAAVREGHGFDPLIGIDPALDPDAVRGGRIVGVIDVDKQLVAVTGEGDIFDGNPGAKVNRIGARVIGPVDIMEGVRAVATIEDVPVVAGTAKNRVVTGAADQEIVPAVPGQRIVTGAAIEVVGALVADNDLIAGAALNQQIASIAARIVDGRLRHVKAEAFRTGLRVIPGGLQCGHFLIDEGLGIVRVFSQLGGQRFLCLDKRFFEQDRVIEVEAILGGHGDVVAERFDPSKTRAGGRRAQLQRALDVEVAALDIDGVLQRQPDADVK